MTGGVAAAEPLVSESAEPLVSGSAEPVIVTGVGLVTALGGDSRATWQGIAAGGTALAPITGWDAGRYPNRHAGEVHGVRLPPALAARGAGRYDRCHQFLLTATAEALAQAGLDGDGLAGIDPARVGVILGSSLGGTRSAQMYERRRLAEGRAVGRLLRDYLLHTCLDAVTAMFGFRGPRTVFSTACTASTIAIAYAFELLRRGRVDMVITGGVDPLTELTLAGFSSMNNVSPQACAPFSQPTGLTMGEGAGILVLERDSVAAARRARPRARVMGYGLGCDAHHATSPDPSGKVQVATARTALSMAGLGPDDLDYVNAHGTGTVGNDEVETRSLRILLGERAGRVPVSSQKGALGHTLGAAGGVEAALTVVAVEEGTVPPTANFTGPRPHCDLDYVPGTARPWDIRHALSQNFAFGGNNAALVFAHPAAPPPAVPAAPAALRVVVTGLGVVTPAALSADELRDLFDSDRTAIAPVRRFDTADLPSRLAAAFDVFQPEKLTRASVRRMDRFGCFTLLAAEMALKHSGLRLAPDNQDRVGIIAGTTHGPVSSCQSFYRPVAADDGQRLNPALFPNTVFNAGVGQAAIHLRTKGCNIALSCGFAAGLSALATASDLIRAGSADLILAGGVDEVERCILEGYAAVRAIAPLARGGSGVEGCTPFAAAGSGPVLGEGGVMLALERLDRAQARGARILAEVAGWGGSADTPLDRGRDPGGEGIADAIRAALTDAGVTASDVDLVAAAGLSHPLIDRAEAAALARVFGERAVPVTALSARFGSSAVTPAVAAAAVALGMGDGFAPWAPGSADAVLPLLTAAGGAAPRVALVNGLSLGGTNYSLVLKRFEG